MAVLQMSKIRICAVKKDRKRLLEFLQRQGCVEVHASDTCDVFSNTNVHAARSVLSKGAEAAKKATEVLAQYCPEDASILQGLKGRKRVDVKQGDAFYKKSASVLKTARKIASLHQEIEEIKLAVLKMEEQEEALKPWLELPVSQTFKGTKYTRVWIGSIDGEHTPETIAGKLFEAKLREEAFHIEVVRSTKQQTYFYVITLQRCAKEVEDALRSAGFVYPANPNKRTPEQAQKRLQGKKQEALQKLQEAKEKIESYADMREDFRFLEDHMIMREEKYGVIEKLAQSRHTFVLNGYIADCDLPALEQKLVHQFDCIIEKGDTLEDENAPVKLRNNWFVEPGESILESYSMPGKAEIDPTPVMSVFYYIMFGLMFSDAGYGILLAGVCGAFLLAFKSMEQGTKRFLSLFFWCGISTTFWGIVFSSYFGDVVNVVTRVFFGKEVGIPPLWFAPLESPMKLLIFCLGIGIVHLVAGYVMNAVKQAKNGQYIDILYDTVFPVTILFCLVLVLMGSKMFYDMAGFQLNLGPSTVDICLAIAGICMLGVVLTGGRESRNWVKRLLKGIYALYNVLAGWLGDILSYSRLLALGLATGVIASVINSLGSMAGSGIAGAIIFLLVFLVGHAMNFGINVLGAYVHSNRLEYVEFFGKFYEGGGRKFLPYGIHTKYYTIEEATQDV